MGAKFGATAQFSESSYQTYVSSKEYQENGASFMGASFSKRNDKESENIKKGASSTKNVDKYSFGSKPPPDGKADTWASQSFNDPMPI